MIEDNCLLVFVLWHDKPRVFMRMCGATISMKSQSLLVIALYKVDYDGLITLCKHARMVNVTRALLRADYISVSLFEAIAVNLIGFPGL